MSQTRSFIIISAQRKFYDRHGETDNAVFVATVKDEYSKSKGHNDLQFVYCEYQTLCKLTTQVTF